jgi:uncharacterized membrane protein YgcG
MVLTPAEQIAALAMGSSEIKFLFGREKIPEVEQAKLFHVGVTTVNMFAALVKDQNELTILLKDELGIDASVNIASRVIAASFICAYDKAKARSSELARYEGELQARQMPKVLPSSEYLAMKAAFETKWWHLEDTACPSRVLIEKRAEEMESGELKAELLTTVTNREQDSEDYLEPVWDTSGNVRMRKQGQQVPEPENPEQLRRRMDLSFTALMFLGLRHTDKVQLTGITPQLAPRYCEYLLGEFVWGLVAKDPEGRTISAPTWNLITAYDLAIRKKAYRLMSEGTVDFTACLKDAWMDPTTKERHFTTPLSLAASTGQPAAVVYNANKRPFVQNESWVPAHSGKSGKGGKGGKGGGKGGKGGSSGKGGGKSEGKGKGKGMDQCAALTPEGERICFAFNNSQVRCKKAGCFFKHVCGRCFQRHPIYQCKGNGAKAPETQGSGQQSS